MKISDNQVEVVHREGQNWSTVSPAPAESNVTCNVTNSASEKKPEKKYIGIFCAEEGEYEEWVPKFVVWGQPCRTCANVEAIYESWRTSKTKNQPHTRTGVTIVEVTTDKATIVHRIGERLFTVSQ